MRTLLALSLLPLVACGVTVRASCEVVEEVDLADDELSSLDITPDDLVAMIGGDHPVAGAYGSGEAVDLEVGVTRGTGPAHLLRQKESSIRKPNGKLFGEDLLLIAVSCDDVLTVPVALRVASADGAVTFDEAAEAVSVQGGSPGDISVRAVAPAADVEGLPLLEGEAPVSVDAYVAFQNVHPGAHNEALFVGSLAWEGNAGSEGRVDWEGPLAR